MKRIVIAGSSALALAITAGSAAAADLRSAGQPLFAPQPPLLPTAFLQPPYWTGFYLGINGGGGWGGSQWDAGDRFHLFGGLIGGTIGFNWQFGPGGSGFVLGVEGDLDWSGINGSTTALCPLGCETRNHWLATVRGRAGYAFGLLLPYLTGGLAAGDIRASTPGLPAGSTTSAGWTFGGGLEYGFVTVPRLSVKAEYLHVDLGEFNCGLNCGLPPGGNVSFHANILRAGLNVRF